MLFIPCPHPSMSGILDPLSEVSRRELEESVSEVHPSDEAVSELSRNQSLHLVPHGSAASLEINKHLQNTNSLNHFQY